MAETFRCRHRVSYAECTLGNHVYYARYLDILERARGEFWRALGQPFLRWQEQDAIFPVVECRLRYLGPARYDDELEIEIWLTALQGVRLEFAYRIRKGAGADLVTASTLHVCTNTAEKPRRLPPELAEALQPFLELSS